MVDIVFGVIFLFGAYVVYNMIQYSGDLKRVNEAAYREKHTNPKKRKTKSKKNVTRKVKDSN